MHPFVLVPIVYVATALALPTITTRQNACNSLGAGSSDTLSYNFTLAAIDMDSPDNSTGVNLALAPGPPGTSGEASVWLLSTVSASYQSGFPTFSLTAGALIPNPNASEHGLAAYDSEVSAGDEVEFIVTQASNSSSNVANYCAVSDAADYATLTVNDDANNFSLCETTGSAYILVYKAASDNDGGYEFDTCIPKRVQAVRL